MSRQPTTPGLKLRTAAAARLRAVLGGAPFVPLSAAELPDSRDRAVANRLVTTALRRHGHLDIVLVELLERGMPKKSGSFEAALRIALAQLLFLPDLGAHSAVFLGVEAIKADPQARHLKGLANAVLRRASGEAARFWDLPPEQLFPSSLREGWRAAYGEDAPARYGEALLAGAPLDLTLKEPSPDLIEVLGADQVLADSIRLPERDRAVEALPGYSEGQWWVQDVAAAMPARLIQLPQGAAVLDVGAAPGGKTAQLLKAGYSVTALDSDEGRTVRLRENLARLGYDAEIVVEDALQWRADDRFDAVLLDAPCSATGIFRRHPEVVWHRSPADVAGRVRLQRRLIEAAVRFLKPGGTLVYCVCSLEPDEGEGQAAWVAEALPQLSLAPVTTGEMGGLELAVTAAGHLRTHPALPLPNEVGGGMDGFFAARWTKGLP